MKISACYITKNEEGTLPRSVTSIRGAFDELIVVDTGSDDRTRAVAAALGAHVYDVPWQGDFAAARNAALARVTGDWVLFLDADESYAGEPSLRALVEAMAARGDVDGVRIPLADVQADGAAAQEAPVWVCRLFRADPLLRYGGRVHEQLYCRGGTLRLVDAPPAYAFHHTGYQPDRLPEKFRRNLALLQQDIAERGERPQHYFYLADCYFGLQRWEEALAYSRRALAVPVAYADSTVKIRHILIESLRRTGAPPEEMLAATQRARQSFPAYAEFAAEEGMVLGALGRLPEAEEALLWSLRLYFSPDRAALRDTYLTVASLAVIARRLGELAEQRGAFGEAALGYALAQSFLPDDADRAARQASLARRVEAALPEDLRALAAAQPDCRDGSVFLALLDRLRQEASEALRALVVSLALAGEGLLPHERMLLLEAERQLWTWLAARRQGAPEADAAPASALSVQEPPLVSILIPTYNAPDIFRRTLRSAARQTYPHLEILVADNSTDERTARVLEDYAGDARVRYLRHPDARTKEENFAPFEQAARGDYLQWLMHDDILRPDKVARMAAVLTARPDITLVTSQRAVIDAQGRLTGGSGLEARFPFGDSAEGAISGEDTGRLMLTTCGNWVGEPSAALFRRTDLVHHYWHAESRGYLTISDVAMWLELLEKGNLYVFRAPLSYFRWHASQEGQQPETIVRSRLEWFRLGSDYYRRKVFLVERQAYERQLRLLVGDHDHTLQPFASRVAPLLWREYERMIEKCRAILGTERKEPMR